MKATTERPARECLILARSGLLDVWKKRWSTLAAANPKAVLRGDALPETDVVVAPGRKVPVA